MSTVIALAGKRNSGKSTIGRSFAKAVKWPYVSFGDYVRRITRTRGLPDKREIWQEVGEELIRTNMKGFCEAVLAEALDTGWRPGMSLVIDGVRHVEVSHLLRELVAPSKYVLTLIEVDEVTRRRRSDDEGIRPGASVKKIDSHSTERQTDIVLPNIADFIISGNEPLSSLIEKLRDISSERTSSDRTKELGHGIKAELLWKRVKELDEAELERFLLLLLNDQKIADEIRYALIIEERREEPAISLDEYLLQRP